MWQNAVKGFRGERDRYLGYIGGILQAAENGSPFWLEIR